MAKDYAIKITAKDKTKAAFRSIQSSLTGVNGKIAAVGTAVLGLAGAGGLGMLINNSMKAADEIGKMSDRLNMSAESFQALHHQAGLFGLSAGMVNSSIERMVKRLGESAAGGGAAKKALDELGISSVELIKLNADQQYMKIADAIGSLDTHAERAAATAAIFGREGIKMVNMFQDGGDGIRAATEELESFGIAIDRVQIKKIENANDSFFRMGQVMRGAGTIMAAELAPYMEETANLFLENAKQSGGFGNMAVSALESVSVGLGYVGNAVRALKVVWKVLELTVAGVQAGMIKGLNELQKGIVDVVNMLPMVDLQPFQGLNNLALASAGTVSDLKQELAELTSAEMPTDNIRNWFEQIRNNANQQAFLQVNPEAAVAGSGEDEEVGEKEKEKNEILLSIAEQFQESLTKIERDGIAARHKFDKKTSLEKTKFVLGNLTSLLGGAAQHSKKFFKLNKAAGIANAIVNTSEGVTKTLSAYPFPINVGMAAATLAAGMAQVKTIKSQSFGGAGTPPAPNASASVSVPSQSDVISSGGSESYKTTETETVEAQKPTVVINLGDDDGLLSVRAVRNLLEQISEVAPDTNFEF